MEQEPGRHVVPTPAQAIGIGAVIGWQEQRGSINWRKQPGQGGEKKPLCWPYKANTPGRKVGQERHTLRFQSEAWGEPGE